MKSVGIDSGSKGCICVLDTQEKTAKYLYLPYRKDDVLNGRLIDITFECFSGVDRMTLEKVQGRGGGDTKWGATQTFGFGRNYGMILMYLSYYPHHLVVPQVWQKAAHKLAHGITAKEKTQSAFDRLNPSYGGIATSENGLADAFFIARYGLDQLGCHYTDDWNFFNMK
jgi:hypothetical protein